MADGCQWQEAADTKCMSLFYQSTAPQTGQVFPYLGLAPVAELLHLLGETPRCNLIAIDTTLPFFTSLLVFHSFIALILTH